MKLPWLTHDTPFPPVEQALRDPDGLLAAGADLSLERLRQAYSNGVFPWYAEGEPILWWSPNPRMVLQCERFAPSHSLRKQLRRIAREEYLAAPSVQVRVDTAFASIIAECAKCRPGQLGTWINPDMQRAYLAWHAAGQVHSIETWMNGQLTGGLYGISLGGMFFGESMFSRANNASKIALAYLVQFLRRHGVTWIDCQQQTTHLTSLGAMPVSRRDFQAHLREALTAPTPPWACGWLDSAGVLQPLNPNQAAA